MAQPRIRAILLAIGAGLAAAYASVGDFAGAITGYDTVAGVPGLPAPGGKTPAHRVASPPSAPPRKPGRLLVTRLFSCCCRSGAAGQMRGHAGARRSLRSVRGWWPDRNPLRRRCDRAEAAVVTMLVGVFLAGAPLLALSAGRQAPHGGPPAGQAQRAGWHQVPAVLRTATIQRFAPSPAPAWAQWTAPGGVVHAGRVPAPAGLSAGAVVPVWVDAAGRLAGPPAPPGQHGSQARADGMVAVLLLAELLCGAGLAAHRVADRRRLAAWDAEWRAIGPAWGGHP